MLNQPTSTYSGNIAASLLTSAPMVLAKPAFIAVAQPVKLHDGAWARPACDAGDFRIFIVDDEELNIRVARKYLKTWGYQHVDSTNQPTEAIERILQSSPDLILLDVMMPEISGLELLAQMRKIEVLQHIPIVILTAHIEESVKYEALNLGANDFLSKPIDPLELLPRVKNLLTLRGHQKWLKDISESLEREVKQRTEALERAQHHVVHCLARASEYRDNETGRHVRRVGAFAALIARNLGLGTEYTETIEQAAKLHDVGKIGIPDDILFKPGKLDADEFSEMKTHCDLGMHVISTLDDSFGDDTNNSDEKKRHVRIGANILEAGDTPLLKMAGHIALTHHEKWDGSGYPLGLVGEQIPLEGRITAVADVFDALCSKRPYKPAFSPEKCRTLLIEGRGSHFDPRVLDAFLKSFDEAVQIQIRFADQE